MSNYYKTFILAIFRLFFIIDLREFFSDLGSGDGKEKKKSSENDQLTGHFQSFF